MDKPLILIVEDQLSLQEMLETVVERLLNASPARADRAAVVSEKVENLKPVLVIMDTAVPDAIRTIDQLKSNPSTRHVPIIAVNTRGWMTCSEALEAGFDACVGDGNIDRLEEVARQFISSQSHD